MTIGLGDADPVGVFAGLGIGIGEFKAGGHRAVSCGSRTQLDPSSDPSGINNHGLPSDFLKRT